MNVKDCKVIDLFCGIGGLTHGFVLEGFEVIAGLDIDSSCSYAYQTNNNAQFIQSDIRLLESEKLKNLFSDAKVKVLIGCAPCQPFSKYAFKPAKKNNDWELVKKFAELIQELRPEIVSMENVPLLRHHEVFKQFCKTLKSLGYSVSWSVIYGPDYGLPQERERLVLLASLLGDISILDKTYRKEDYQTVRDAIGNLPPISSGESHNEDPLHKASRLSEKNLERIKASKPGGTWHDWPSELVAKCHTRDSGKGYTSVYGRMEWDKPSPTITTQFLGFGNGRFGHPEQNRGISIREGAILQTFPQTYKFFETTNPISLHTLTKHIGNAVPVILGKVIAQSILNHLEGK